MNDLDLLTRLGNETPLPDHASLVPARARVVAGLTATGNRRRPSRRTLLTASAVAAAAAIAAAAVTLSTLAPASRPAPRANGNVTVAQLLDLAAAAALTQQPVVPKPDQYVYVKEYFTETGVMQIWTPVDDKLSGLMKTGNQAPVVTSEERPGFYPGMPTSASMMPGFFAKLGVDVRDVYFVHLATEILSTDYLLPGQRAAFYKFLATVQGATVVNDVRDAAGRPGTGLVWTIDGAKWMLIFDSRTYAYLGGKLGARGGKAWQLSAAQLQKAIVNRPGQLP